MKHNYTVDLLISHSQIQVRSRAFDAELSQWGEKTLTKGLLFIRTM